MRIDINLSKLFINLGYSFSSISIYSIVTPIGIPFVFQYVDVILIIWIKSSPTYRPRLRKGDRSNEVKFGEPRGKFTFVIPSFWRNTYVPVLESGIIPLSMRSSLDWSESMFAHKSLTDVQNIFDPVLTYLNSPLNRKLDIVFNQMFVVDQ